MIHGSGGRHRQTHFGCGGKAVWPVFEHWAASIGGAVVARCGTYKSPWPRSCAPTIYLPRRTLKRNLDSLCIVCAGKPSALVV
jgi:hypothetical protein